MASILEQLLALLDLERVEADVYRGISPPEPVQRVFGGQVLAQALTAATRTVEGRVCHSLHAYFLRPGDPQIPILYQVDRSRDGASFAARRVVAVQREAPIFTLARLLPAPGGGLRPPGRDAGGAGARNAGRRPAGFAAR